MTAFIVRRLLVGVGVVWVMSLVIYASIFALPGNAAHMILGQYATPEDIAIIEHKLGLDQPFLVQYGRWLGGVLHGDFGRSLSMDRPVGPLVLENLGRSAVLMAFSLVLIAVIGIGLGVWAGANKGSLGDRVMTIAQYCFVAVPEFFWCILAIMVFAGWLNLFPATGYSPIAEDGIVEWARHLVLPVLTLVIGFIAHIARLTRSSMIDVLQTNYVLAARAKGLPERLVLRRHALPNALLPTVTVLALDVGLLIGGIVVVETIFAYPGLGRLLIQAIGHQDVPVIVASIMVITAIYSLSNLVADVLYALLNPKIRFARGAG